MGVNKMTKLNKLFTPKQQEVINQELTNPKWKLMINYGAVRAGKTFVDNFVFMYEVRHAANVAQNQGIEHPLYILAGVSSKSIYNNVITEMMNTFGVEFKFDKHNSFKIKFSGLPAVTVTQTFTGSISGLGAVRGMTATGAYINEASLANEEVFTEIRQRCSVPGARVVCDTNPDVPTHWLKKNYIDNPNDSTSIISNHFTIDDNTFLDKDYVQSLKESTPTGMFYDRAILGLWVSGEGVVYRDFDKNISCINANQVPQGLTYYAGVDWGYSHPGSIVVLGDDNKGNTYLVHEHTKKFEEIGYWVDYANKLRLKYGEHMQFYCDSAREEHIARFIREGIHAVNSNKSVLSGIESVAKSIKTKHFFVVEENTESFMDEIYNYIWDETNDAPVKDHDHCLTGDTLVDTTDGQVPIEKLVDKSGNVYCVDRNNNPTIGRFDKVRKTQSAAKIYEIELEDGSFIKATADHPVLTNNGWKTLIELTEKDEIMAIR